MIKTQTSAKIKQTERIHKGYNACECDLTDHTVSANRTQCALQRRQTGMLIHSTTDQSTDSAVICRKTPHMACAQSVQSYTTSSESHCICGRSSVCL